MARFFRKILFLMILISLTGGLLVTNLILDRWFILRGFQTLLSLSIVYLLLKIMMEEMMASRVKDYKLRYNARKIVSILFILISTLVVVTLWIKNTQAILVAYGLIAAGIAISLQDFFKGFIGGLLILVNSLYRVGDRIQIGSVYGDVMDIGIFYTTLMETRGWVRGDQASGRMVSVPNAKVLSEDVYNYTKDHSFLWEELTINLSYDSNWESIIKPVQEILIRETADMTLKASKEIERIGEKYYLPKKDVEPNIYLDFDNSWINMRIRFVTEARTRRALASRIHQLLLKEISKHKDVKIAQAQIETWKLGEGP